MSLFCVLFIIEQNYSDSRYHFLFTSDGHQCASMLVENATTRGYPGEADLFVTQAVLQYVSCFIIQLHFVEYKYHAIFVIMQYLYSGGPVGKVCRVLLLLTNQLAGFPALIPFRFAYFCHAFPINK